MSMSLPRRVLRLQYNIARLPLQVFEATVVSRLDGQGQVRSTYEQVVGSLDGTVGALLGDSDLARRGEKMRTAAAELAKATELEARARKERADAARRTQQRVDTATADAAKAREKAEADLEEAADHEIDAKVQAGKQAAARLEDRKGRADEIADRRIEAAEAEREAKLDEVERRVEEKKAPRKKELDEAARKLEEAEAKREDAERLDDVAEASKAASTDD